MLTPCDLLAGRGDCHKDGWGLRPWGVKAPVGQTKTSDAHNNEHRTLRERYRSARALRALLQTLSWHLRSDGKRVFLKTPPPRMHGGGGGGRAADAPSSFLSRLLSDLDPWVDTFVLMTVGYSDVANPGPNAPIGWMEENLRSAFLGGGVGGTFERFSWNKCCFP